MKFIFEVFEYDEKLFNEMFEMNRTAKRERLRRKKAEKNLLLTQEDLAHKRNEIAELINVNRTREFTQAPTETTRETTRTSYRSRGIHPSESLKEENEKKYGS
jgi:hypothetical protein